jgi:uncharacterized protein YbbC (DUF1343 family)
MDKVALGVDRFCSAPSEFVKKDEAVGLICNQASVDSRFAYTADLLHLSDAVALKSLFGPQHGIRGDVQDNMIETGHSIDRKTGLPIFSLYSETREPTSEMIDGLDALIFDLQDIGGRVYTFIYTMANAMKACAKHGKRFVVLDRPNPIGGISVEGNLLEVGHESFVGQYPIPMRHGLTVGELARMFNTHFEIGCDLEVVEMDGWARSMYMEETGCPWVMPSPNMPTVDTAVVFPGTVFLEGTEVSEGRGTTRPFELAGAPFIEPDAFANHLNSYGLPGVYFRATVFMPGFQKFSNEACGGVFIHVIDRRVFRPVVTGIAVTKAVYDLYPEQFQWKQAAYEYEFERNPFDVIAGSKNLRKQIEAGRSIEQIADSWNVGERSFKDLRTDYVLYE